MFLYTPQTPDTYLSPLEAGSTFKFVSAFTIFKKQYNDSYLTTYLYYKQIVSYNGSPIWDNTYIIINDTNTTPTPVFESKDLSKIEELKTGSYEIYYEIGKYERTPESYIKYESCYYRFQVVENRYPLRKQTVLDVVNRILELADPLVWKSGKNEYVALPRFKFAYKYYDESKSYEENSEDGKAEFNLFNQTSPEFTFTRQTLRECLQQIGQFIHAEPRLTDLNTIIYDRYGEQDRATYRRNSDGVEVSLSEHPYKRKQLSHDLNIACTSVESDVENFVNRLDKLGGAVAEPFRNGAITLRSDAVYTRLEDSENLYFPTKYPIMDITSFKWVDKQGFAGTANEIYDITPYIFEKTIYDANLSSYDKQYPRSKSYALYFTQSQKNIEGFFFKNEEWTGGVLSNYSIVNILSQVSGKDLSGTLKKIDKEKHTGKYPTLCFELVYTPIYGARLSHGKSYTGDMLKKPFALMYNQSSNVVETRYYGEHLKGVAERLGNVEKSVSIFIRNVGNLPKIGQMWDDDYYISKVTGSAVLDGVWVDLTLSKKFNRLSEYVGANSYKRYYEVSERMSQERRTLYKDYLLITTKAPSSFGVQEDCFSNLSVVTSVANTFAQNASGYIVHPTSGSSFSCVSKIASGVQVQGFSKKYTPQAEVILPITSSAFGNMMEFTWSFKDNYSAGTKVVHQENGSVTGYFGSEVPYGDYYGRMYYEQFYIGAPSSVYSVDQALELPAKTNVSMGASYCSCRGDKYLVVRKDSREILSQAYSIEYVTDMKGLVIGSALSRNNPMIGGVNEKASAALYVFSKRINQFANEITESELDNATLVHEYENDLTLTEQSTQMTLYRNTEGTYAALIMEGMKAPVAGKAWAIVTKRYDGKPQLEESEDGTDETVTPKYGGELLLAFNGEIAEGDTIGQFNIVPIHDIFKAINKHVHEYAEGSHVCKICGEVSAHEYAVGSHVCKICGEVSKHEYEKSGDLCSICGGRITVEGGVEYVVYTVTFDYMCNDENGEPRFSTVTQNSGRPLTEVMAPRPTREGYNFLGWYSDRDCTELFKFGHSVNSCFTLYAGWEHLVYTVRFETNGGTPIVSQTIEQGGYVMEPEQPTKTGYTFVGWYSNSKCTKVFDFSAPIEKNTTIYVLWSRT